MSLPLHGMTILDCSLAFPGARATHLLAGMGARVVRVVHPQRPERTAELSPAAHADLNADKERIAIDLGDPEMRPEFETLLRGADGLIEGFRPETRVRLKLEPETLLAIQPRLCIVGIDGFDPAGPLAGRAGHDIGFAARTGLLALLGTMPPLPLGAIFCADRAAFTMAALLVQALRTGRGAHTRISIEKALLSAQSSQIAEYRSSGKMPEPGGSLYSGAHPAHRVYRSKDGRGIAVGAIEDRYWSRFCDLIGRHDLVGRQNGPDAQAISLEIGAALATRNWSEWKPLFEASDCCVEPVLDYSDLENQGHLR